MPELHTPTTTPVSPLVLSDRLLTLAKDAELAGFSASASRLVGMAFAVFDERPAATN